MISGIILAAGMSSRLGECKQMLNLGGKPLLQYVIDSACSSSLDEVIVVLGHAGEMIKAVIQLCNKARCVTNPYYVEGQSMSLRTGLAATDPSSDATAILLGDQPGLTADVIDRVLEHFRSTSATVVRPTFQGVPGHPVVVRRSGWAIAREATGDAGLRELLSMLDVEELKLDRPAVRDIDTAEDYREALADLTSLQPPM